ncbi:nucleoside-diphosphate kinase, partial [Rickettsiales bacterium]|nr:nucleoside-diphosphate kinase [Rickettsiales bacterium]
ERGFFDEMVEEMSSGDVVVYLLKKPNAVKEHRDIIGATNPSEAHERTIRGRYGLSVGQNSIHGSDSDENAMKEIEFFFGDVDLV